MMYVYRCMCRIFAKSPKSLAFSVAFRTNIDSKHPEVPRTWPPVHLPLRGGQTSDFPGVNGTRRNMHARISLCVSPLRIVSFVPFVAVGSCIIIPLPLRQLLLSLGGLRSLVSFWERADSQTPNSGLARVYVHCQKPPLGLSGPDPVVASEGLCSAEIFIK